MDTERCAGDLAWSAATQVTQGRCHAEQSPPAPRGRSFPTESERPKAVETRPRARRAAGRREARSSFLNEAVTQDQEARSHPCFCHEPGCRVPMRQWLLWCPSGKVSITEVQALWAPGSNRGPGTKETKHTSDDPATETNPPTVDVFLCSEH